MTDTFAIFEEYDQDIEADGKKGIEAHSKLPNLAPFEVLCAISLTRFFSNYRGSTSFPRLTQERSRRRYRYQVLQRIQVRERFQIRAKERWNGSVISVVAVDVSEGNKYQMQYPS